MRRNPFLICVQLLLLAQSKALLAERHAEVVLLQADNFEHIEFRRIKPNQHIYQDQHLQINVDDSASFLMKPFDTVRKISQVSFEWRSEGVPKIKNAQHEAQRPGDDSVFKLGLLLEAEESIHNPFLPSWMKRVEKLLNYPSENMIYLVADAKHAPGVRWKNPYNERVTMIAMVDGEEKNGWQKSSFNFEVPVHVVALWLMSDGDNTDSRFTAHIRNIQFK